MNDKYDELTHTVVKYMNTKKRQLISILISKWKSCINISKNSLLNKSELGTPNATYIFFFIPKHGISASVSVYRHTPNF